MYDFILIIKMQQNTLRFTEQGSGEEELSVLPDPMSGILFQCP